MILFLAVLGLILYLAERYSMNHVLDMVTFHTVLNKILVEPGESFTWNLSVENRKRFMVPYLKIREQVPEGLVFSENEMPAETERGRGLTSVLYLPGRQKTELARNVRLLRRGRYFFRGVSAEAEDFLGIDVVRGSYPELKELVVKPEPYPHGELSLLLGGYLGEFAVKKSLFEDPVLTLGFREYTGREPFRSISWTQSARLGRLLVKQQECTADMTCSVLLNVEYGREEGDAKLLERCFSMVRSICEELERRKIAYDFRTNGVIAGAMGNWKQVGEGLGAGHLGTVLEGLGRMTYDHRESAVEFLSAVLTGTQAGRGFLFVAPRQNGNLSPLLKAMEERSGQKVLTIYAEEMEE